MSQPGPPGFQLTGCFVTGFRADKGSRFEGQCLLLKHRDPRLLHLKVLESPAPSPPPRSARRQPCCAPALGTAILTPCGQSEAAVWGGQCGQAMSLLTGGQSPPLQPGKDPGAKGPVHSERSAGWPCSGCTAVTGRPILTAAPACLPALRTH